SGSAGGKNTRISIGIKTYGKSSGEEVAAAHNDEMETTAGFRTTSQERVEG
ncbi:hypothetical protein Tco_0623740, partial [Tanacetum coccineum]